MVNLPSNHELLKEFSAFLVDSGLSSVSIKNYLSDLRHFFNYLEQKGITSLENIYLNISNNVKEYQSDQKVIFTPQASINRRMASIRRFTTFLKVRYEIDFTRETPQPDQNTSSLDTNPIADNLHNQYKTQGLSNQKIVDQFKSFLKSEKKTNSTVKNYVSDVYHYFSWIDKSTPFNVHHLSEILSKNQLEAYSSFLKLSQTGISVIARRQSSIKKLALFCSLQGFIPKNPFEYQVPLVKIAPLTWLTRHLPKLKNDQNTPKTAFGKAYFKYSQLPFTPYLHLAILVLATTAMAILGYNQIIKLAKPASAALNPPKRQLSFQGRLSDSSGTPITTAVNVNFRLWDDLTAGTQLYTSGTCSVTPDNQGVFNSLIGDGVCGSEIPQSVFAENVDVFLEVRVGAETLTPRQQIATVGYALNSETLQGYPAADPATINSVPVIDGSGNINISATSPSIISTSGNFTLTGESLSLTTETNSGGNIVFQPDAIGEGQILALGSTTNKDTFRVTNANLTTGSLISGYVGNDVATGSGNLILLSSGATETAKFWVTADGRTSIHTATDSANTSALIVDQNGTGNIFSASSSGATRFILNNLGAITAIDGVSHIVDDLSGDLRLTSNSTNIILNDNVTFGGTTTLNGQTYTWPASQTPNYVLQTDGAGALSWVAQTGGGNTLWDQQNGALYPLNSTVDFLLGGQSTSSAKFSVTNLNSGTPTASLSGSVANVSLFYDGNGNISTTNRQDLVLGNSSAYNSTGNILLNSNGTGLVGIGIASPDRLLHAESNSATTNAVTYLERLTSMTTGTAVSGIGSGLEFETENAAGSAKLSAAVEGILTNVTNTKEQGALVFRTADLGSATLNEAARFTNTGDLVTNGHTDITALANSTDIFVYDTTKDLDGGIWRNNGAAKSSSWYNETLDDTAANCDPSTNDRCGRREFPEKSFIITTTSNIYIYDAKDNYMWMKFSQGIDFALGVDTNNNPSSVHAQNGKIYIGTNGSAATGLYIIDLKQDKITRFDETDARDFAGRISVRNTDPGTAYPDQNRTDFALNNQVINDVHARVVFYTNGNVDSGNGANYTAVATDDGLSLIKESVSEYETQNLTDNPGDDYNQVWLDQKGILWATNETTGSLEKWVSGSLDFFWNETTSPALAASAVTFQVAPSSLYVTDNTSIVDNSSPTVFVGTNLGMTVIHTNNNNEDISSVKYFTKDHISEQMVGDTMGTWSFTETASLTAAGTNIQDLSAKTTTLTVPSGITSNINSVSGVRGTALNFDGSDDYICSDGATDNSTCESDTDLNPTGATFSVGAWFKRDADTGNIDTIISQWGENTADQSYRIIINTDDTVQFETDDSGSTLTVSSLATYQDTLWHHAVGVMDGSNIRLYVDGVNVGIQSGGSVNITSIPLTAGADLSGAGDTPANFFDGNIDEPFITNELLTGEQIKKIYQVGLNALQNHTASRITGVTGADTYQQLLGNAAAGISTTSRVFGVAIDDSKKFAYIGTNASSGNTGGVSLVSLDSDTVVDLYDNTANTTKDDDAGTQFNASDVVSLSVSGIPCSTGYNSSSTNCNSQVTLGITGTNDSATTQWLETTDYSLYSSLANVTSTSQNKNNITANESFQVLNTNRNISDFNGEITDKPAFYFDSQGHMVANYLGASDGTAWDINDSTLISGNFFDIRSTSLSTGRLFSVDLSSLTSGSGFYARAGALTTGSLMNLESSTTNLSGAIARLSIAGNDAGNSGTVLHLTNTGALNTGSTLYIGHQANGAGSLAMRVDDVSGDTTPFVIDANGNVGVGDASPDHKLDVDGNIGLTASSYINWGDTTGTTGYGFRDNAGIMQFKNAAGDWASIGSATPFWDQLNGSLFPLNSTVDFFIGGQSTASAKFAVLNIDSGTPVASVSSGLSGVSSFLTADGTLATTNFQTLTIGNGTTGNIAIGTGSKTLAINSSTWDITGPGVASGLTGLSSSGVITFSGLSPSSAVYTDGSSNLTAVSPTTGILGFWQRNSGAIAPWFITDSVNVGAMATSSALVHLGGTEGETSFFIEPLAIGFNSAITNPGIGGGTTALQVDGDILPGVDDDSFLGRANTAWNRLYLSNGINNSTGTEQISIASRQLTGGQWNATTTLRVGDTTASMPTGREFYVVGDASVSATLFIGGTSDLLGNVTIGNGTGKLDVGTVDPPYTINGEKYATYMSGMIGVKEETVGSVTTNEYLENIGYRKTISFNNQEKGSDLWLFGKTTNIKENLNRISVLLTPNSQAKVWYETDQSKNTLYIYSSSPTSISYRLTAPRFDDSSWANTRTAGVTGFVINDPDNINTQLASIDNFNYSSNIENIDGQFKLIVNGQEKNNIDSFSKALIANLNAGLATVTNLIVNNLQINNKLTSPVADIGELNAINASISGTLFANEIQSNTIDIINEQLDLLNEKYATASSILADIQEKYTQYDSVITNTPPEGSDPLQLSPLATTSAQLPDDPELAFINAQTVFTNDLLANGSIFTQSLNSFEGDLYIQATGERPVRIMANLMTLYPNGQVVVQGDLIVTGNFFANNLDAQTATVSGTLALGRGEVATDSGKLLALFNQGGNIVGSVDASGSANFDKLTTTGIVIASQNNQNSTISATVNTNSTIGTASIATSSAEIFIQNNQINTGTLVYITPISDTDNQVLYVKSKLINEGFTVATSQPVTKETSFNYWLVQTK